MLALMIECVTTNVSEKCARFSLVDLHMHEFGVYSMALQLRKDVHCTNCKQEIAHCRRHLNKELQNECKSQQQTILAYDLLLLCSKYKTMIFDVAATNA